MASARVIAMALWAAPLAAVVALAAWSLYDFLGIPSQVLAGPFVLALLVSLILLTLGLRLANAILRRLGLLLLAASYFLAHVFVLSPDPAALLGYMTLALVALELRLLAARFAPIYQSHLREEDRVRLDDALGRSVLRIGVVAATAFLGSVLAADLALAGTLPLTSVPTALVLAGSLVAVVFLLAEWPSQGRRGAPTSFGGTRIQTPK